MNNNRGISLIVLVITIIVIIILAGVVVISLASNNPILQAKEATFKNNIDTYNSELTLAVSNEYLKQGNFTPSTLNAGVWDGNESNISGTIKEYINNISPEDASKFEIQSGKLVYVGETQNEKNWTSEIGISNGNVLPSSVALNVIATQNSTINGSVASYNNPIIPKGFKAINDGVIWPTGWNSGLVIEDEQGNQFVWVPVDGISVTYSKWDGALTFVYASETSDDILPIGISNEASQIIKYGGFYIARYESGKQSSDTLVSKKNISVWNQINYTDSKTRAEFMYNTSNVKSGLVTGSQWDTVMKWLQNSGINVSSNSSSWGNYGNSEAPANVTGYGTLQVTGYSEYWKANNIYDIIGNSWEWTTEICGNERVRRGGHYWVSGSAYPAAFRNSDDSTLTADYITFRTVLYIL